jgi:hypothetical protein
MPKSKQIQGSRQRGRKRQPLQRLLCIQLLVIRSLHLEGRPSGQRPRAMRSTSQEITPCSRVGLAGAARSTQISLLGICNRVAARSTPRRLATSGLGYHRVAARSIQTSLLGICNRAAQCRQTPPRLATSGLGYHHVAARSTQTSLLAICNRVAARSTLPSLATNGLGHHRVALHERFSIIEKARLGMNQLITTSHLAIYSFVEARPNPRGRGSAHDPALICRQVLQPVPRKTSLGGHRLSRGIACLRVTHIRHPLLMKQQSQFLGRLSHQDRNSLWASCTWVQLKKQVPNLVVLPSWMEWRMTTVQGKPSQRRHWRLKHSCKDLLNIQITKVRGSLIALHLPPNHVRWQSTRNPLHPLQLLGCGGSLESHGFLRAV